MNTLTFADRLLTLPPPRREGLTAIFRRAHELVLPTATGWLNPEDSIGRYICKARRLHIWEAIGPARDVFNRVAPKIKVYLENAMEPISSRVTWSIYMIGKSTSAASPSVIFCCEVYQHRREVRDAIKDSGILKEYPGIKTGDLPRPPDFDQLVPMGAGEQSPYTRDDIMALTSRAKSACGSQLFVNANWSNLASSAATATIGGVIRLGDKCYYTTAAHAISPKPDPGGAHQASPTEHEYDTDDDALSLDGSEDMYSTSTSGPSAVNPKRWYRFDSIEENAEDNRYLRDDILRQWRLKRYHVAEEPRPFQPNPRQQSLNPIGRPFISSMENGNRGAGLDYALTEISSRIHMLENVIKVGPNEGDIVKVHSVVRSEPQNVDIIAVTSRGITKGCISGTPAYSSAQGKYYRMLKVSLDDALERGDCGTWVIDAANGDLFGHIVLGSPGGGSAMLTPFSDIFDDILSRAGMPPTFPTALDDDYSYRSAETRFPPSARKESFSRDTRNTESRKSEKSGSLSIPNNVADKRTNVPSMKIGSQIEWPSDSHGRRPWEEKSQKPLERMLSEMEGGTKQWNLSMRDDSTLATIPLQTAEQNMTLQPELTRSHSFVDFSKDFEQMMDQRRLKPSRQRERTQEFSGVLVPDTSSSPRDPKTKQSSTVFAQSSRSRGYIPRRSDSPESSTSPRYPRFRDVLFTMCGIPIEWERQELLDLALKQVDLKAICSDAEKENQNFISQARSRGIDAKPEWGYQDCVIRALSRYFSRSFFTWISNPPCEACASTLPTIPCGNTQPDQEEKAGRAELVELYQCSEKHCQAYTRFPRYWSVATLLRTRRGRSGESSNCFGMICRALGSRVRWIWSADDNIWTEVYSEHQERWVHVDACSAAWDNPLLYTQALGKKLSYCIAFSVDGAADVTRRYVRASEHSLARTRCSELELLRIIHDINRMRRINMLKEDLARLEREDIAEAQELDSYIVPSHTVETAEN